MGCTEERESKLHAVWLLCVGWVLELQAGCSHAAAAAAAAPSAVVAAATAPAPASAPAAAAPAAAV